MFSKILVANRGEIALRVMRTAREMGIKTVAVFSEADRNAPHVRFADEAVLVGPAKSSESYLVIDKIVEACKLTGAEACHPGYGFLSENPLFAEALEAAGIKLIGPRADSMRVMGNKLAAKQSVLAYGVPMVPGTESPISDVSEATEIASRIGFPVLIKAAAGGGGKGMRLVHRAEDFAEEMAMAIGEATKAFGDGTVFIEKFVTKPRHIEIQVLADSFGHTIYAFERECSIQRRHQKVVEEAPSSVLTPELRQQMGECAVAVATACNYEGAGTVEFLLDADLNFYFLEMNTRLQVEHPVTEMITGLDLVKEQILIAFGEKLRFTQEELKINGHAVEVRVYAEDPANGFLPDTGFLERYRPAQGPGIRVDSGIEEGQEVPIHYDPMLAKLITHAPTRLEAIDKMARAIDEYEVKGVATTLGFGKFVMQHEAFRSGDFDTKFVENYYSSEAAKNSEKGDISEEVVAAVMASRLHKDTRKQQVVSALDTREKESAWWLERK